MNTEKRQRDVPSTVVGAFAGRCPIIAGRVIRDLAMGHVIAIDALIPGFLTNLKEASVTDMTRVAYILTMRGQEAVEASRDIEGLRAAADDWAAEIPGKAASDIVSAVSEAILKAFRPALPVQSEAGGSDPRKPGASPASAGG